MDRARLGGAKPWIPVLVAPNFLGDFIIHLFNKHLLCAYHISDTVWALGHALAHKMVTVPVLLELMAEWEDRLQEINKQPVLQTFISQTFSSIQFSSVAQLCLTLWPHESQHTRPPCPSPTPRVHSDSRPWSQWCHPAISSSVVPFSSCPQSLPASEMLTESASDRQRLFQWVNSSHEVAKVLEFQF